jgi:8-oxo-dGTP pyrophosphatase MutT (NUDIX family)
VTTAPTWAPSGALLSATRAALDAAPGDRWERLCWQSLLSSAGPALLTRDHAPMHLTASAVVLSPDADLTCLVFHRKIQLWVQPGGHFEDGDTSPAQAAARETLEETGLTGEVLPLPALLSRHGAPCRPGVVEWHLDIQSALVTAPAQPQPSDETPRVAWWPVDALPPDRAGGVAELVAAGVRLVRGA